MKKLYHINKLIVYYMFSQYHKLVITIIIAILFFIIGVWEFGILLIYRNNYISSAYIYILVKSFINILFSIFILSKKSNKYLNILITLIIVSTDIWLINLFCNLDHYKLFIKVIIVEFIILNLRYNILIISIIIKFWMSFESETVIINNITHDIIIEIPYAIPNNLEISNLETLPQAIQLKIDE